MFTSLWKYDKTTPQQCDWLSGYWARKWGYLWAGAEWEQQDPKENAAAASVLRAVCALQNNKFHGYQVNSSRLMIQSFKTTLPVYCQRGRHHGTPQLRAISLAAQADSKMGNSSISVALGHRQEIQFSRWNKNQVSSLRTTSVFHTSLPGPPQTWCGCLAASQHDYLEGRQLKCYEAPNKPERCQELLARCHVI